MRADEIISLKEAVFSSGMSESTIRRLCRIHGIARQTTGSAPLQISRVALEMVLHGDLEALQKLRDGKRNEPEVRRYIEFVGLPG